MLCLSVAYALLDGSHTAHLEAARAVWPVLRGLAAYIFGDALGDSIADRLLRAAEPRAPTGSPAPGRESVQPQRLRTATGPGYRGPRRPLSRLSFTQGRSGGTHDLRWSAILRYVRAAHSCEPQLAALEETVKAIQPTTRRSARTGSGLRRQTAAPPPSSAGNALLRPSQGPRPRASTLINVADLPDVEERRIPTENAWEKLLRTSHASDIAYKHLYALLPAPRLLVHPHRGAGLMSPDIRPGHIRPGRIQLQRKKGWRKPAGAVVVARPTRWGNPYKISEYGREEAIARHRQDVLSDPEMIEAIRRELAGRVLACWCPLDQPCHADTLIEIAHRRVE